MGAFEEARSEALNFAAAETFAAGDAPRAERRLTETGVGADELAVISTFRAAQWSLTAFDAAVRAATGLTGRGRSTGKLAVVQALAGTGFGRRTFELTGVELAVELT